MQAAPTTVGFVGLGNQGAPIVERLLSVGFPVTIWARRPQSLLPFVGTAATVAPSLADLAATVDVVGICVMDDDDVMEVVAGLVPGLRPGRLLIVHSTVSPATCVAVAAAVAASETEVVDAPVSGGAVAARAGTLAIAVGGTVEGFDRALPILRALGDPVGHAGPLGAGQTLKLLHNLFYTARLALLEEIGRLGVELDVSGELLAELVCHQRYSGLMERVVQGTVVPASAVRTHHTLTKDVGHAAQLLHDRGLASPVLEDLAGLALEYLRTLAASS